MAPPLLCAWCADFNPHDEAHRTASHGICPACLVKQTAICDQAAKAAKESA